MTTAWPRRSTGITPLLHYHGPLRLPTHRHPRLLIPATPPGYEPQHVGSPGFLDQSFATRHPLSPRQAEPVHALMTSRFVLASAFPAAWPPATCVSRPIPVQPLTAYGSQLRCPQLAPLRSGPFPNRSRSPRFVTSTRQTAATCFISIYMAATSQAARLARLFLAHRKHTEGRKENVLDNDRFRVLPCVSLAKNPLSSCCENLSACTSTGPAKSIILETASENQTVT